jgi:hypothetical protein
MSEEMVRRSILDEEHLKLLALGYLVSGGVNAFFSMFGVMYAVMGIMMGKVVPHIPTVPGQTSQEPPAFLGGLFTAIGLGIFFLMIASAAAKFWTAWCIKQRKSRTFCMVIAGISCLGFPYGTFLGVLSFMVLGRDSVAQLFSLHAPS